MRGKPHVAHQAMRGKRQPVRKELSAGGVAVRRDGEQLLVALLQTEHKRGLVWVLPKGHVELHEGERVSEAARREVMEEAGLKDLSVKDQLGVTRFRFQAEGTVVFKTVHYFLMTTNQKQLVPQEEEALLDAKWFPIDEALRVLAYDTDQEIVRRAYNRLEPDKAPPKPRAARLQRRGQTARSRKPRSGQGGGSRHSRIHV